MNQRKVSRRFYLFEEIIEDLPGFASLRQRRSIAELQLLAGLVWAKEGGRGACPIVRPRAHPDLSYCVHDKPATIHLCRAHRNFSSLLHELAHALGTRDKLNHGPAFRKRCVRFYREYGGWSGEVNFDEKPEARQ